MLQPDKNNFFLTCEAGQKLTDIRQELQKHDLSFGYHPLATGDFSLENLIHGSPLNLYHFKYGSLSDNIAAIQAELDNGDVVQTSSLSARKAAPDFCHMILGLPSRIAKITGVTLKITLKPEKIQAIVFVLPRAHTPQMLIGHLVANRIEPLFFRIFEKDETKKILSSKKTNRQAQTAILVGLSGLSEIVDAKLQWLRHHAQTQNLQCMHPNKNSGSELFNHHIFASEHHATITRQYRKMIWPVEENPASQKHMEQALFKKFDLIEVNHV